MIARHKYKKILYTKKGEGSQPQLVIAENENTQSKFVIQKILELREEGIPLEEIAVLFRSSYHSFDLEIELTKANIPFIKFGGFKFIETAHIKDMIAYLRVIENHRDVVAWNRILLLIKGVGPRSAEKIIDNILSRQVHPERFGANKFWQNYHDYPEKVRDLFGDGKRLRAPMVLRAGYSGHGISIFSRIHITHWMETNPLTVCSPPFTVPTRAQQHHLTSNTITSLWTDL